jgi:hypothetical protein
LLGTALSNLDKASENKKEKRAMTPLLLLKVVYALSLF